MSSLMWLLFLALLVLLALSLLWLIWKLRHFSESQNQPLDDKLLQVMLSDAAFSGKVKEGLLKKSGAKTAEQEPPPAEQ